MQLFRDLTHLPRMAETPAERLERSLPLPGTAGESYVEGRGVPCDVASAAGVRYDPDLAGRPAVVAPLLDGEAALAALHGRYLHSSSVQDKMCTFGAAGGAFSLSGWRRDPVILVEGLFDALSLAVCGYQSLATIGRWAPWLPEACAGREVWVAFDAGRAGEASAAIYRKRLAASRVHRLLPPPRCKDWNTALVKGGAGRVASWIERELVGEMRR